MNKGFSFTYWVGKVASLFVFAYPVLTGMLPHGWENVTLGVVAHFIVDYANQYYHAA